MMLKTEDAFTGPMFDAINGMLVDMLAAIVRKYYDDRRAGRLKGIAKAKAEGHMKVRPEDAERSEAIMDMLRKGQSWDTIVREGVLSYPHQGRGVGGQLVEPQANGTASPSDTNMSPTSWPSAKSEPQLRP